MIHQPGMKCLSRFRVRARRRPVPHLACRAVVPRPGISVKCPLHQPRNDHSATWPHKAQKTSGAAFTAFCPGCSSRLPPVVQPRLPCCRTTSRNLGQMSTAAGAQQQLCYLATQGAENSRRRIYGVFLKTSFKRAFWSTSVLLTVRLSRLSV